MTNRETQSKEKDMTRSTRRELSKVTAALAAISMLLSACGNGAAAPGNDEDPGSEPDTIRLLQAAPSSVVFNALFVGEELGYFEEENIVVEDLDAGELTEVAFLDNGQADIAFTGASEILQGVEADTGVQVLYEYWQIAIEGIVVSEDSQYQTLADIEGGTVGLASDSDQAVLNLALESEGIPLDAVEVVIVGDSGGVVAAALAEGSIDAYVGSTRDFRNLISAGEPIRDITPEGVKANPGESFIALDSVVEEKADAIERFLRAWAKATHASLHSEEALVAMATKHVPEAVQEPLILEAALAQAAEGNKPLTENYGELRLDVWERVVSQLVSTGDITTSVDPNAFLDDRFIAGANDFDRAEVEAEVEEWLASNS